MTCVLMAAFEEAQCRGDRRSCRGGHAGCFFCCWLRVLITLNLHLCGVVPFKCKVLRTFINIGTLAAARGTPREGVLVVKLFGSEDRLKLDGALRCCVIRAVQHFRRRPCIFRIQAFSISPGEMLCGPQLLKAPQGRAGMVVRLPYMMLKKRPLGTGGMRIWICRYS